MGIALILCIARVGWAQNFYVPEVVVNSRGLSERSRENLLTLQQQLEYMLINYAPDIDVDKMPKHPVRIVVSLFIDQALGDQYDGSMEVAIYRPVYGKINESLLLFLHDNNLKFHFTPSQTPSFVGRSIPQDNVGKLLYYYATLGALYYYDSFSLKGGTPFLAYLQSNGQFFENGMSEIRQLTSNNNPLLLSPNRHISELLSEIGELFRELWYIYHREGLDSTKPYIYTGILIVTLQALQKLNRLDSTSSFLPLFIGAKETELCHFFQDNKDNNNVRTALGIAEELFPSVIFVK